MTSAQVETSDNLGEKMVKKNNEAPNGLTRRINEDEIDAHAVKLKTALNRRRRRALRVTLADHPQVARYYRAELNGGIPAEEIPQHLDIDVIWCCDAIPGEMHLWAARPQNFTRTVLKQQSKSTGNRREKRRFSQLLAAGLSPTKGCPACVGCVASEGYNLLVVHPETARYWDYERNPYGPENYTPCSDSVVYWRDPNSNRPSQASIASRTQRGRVGTNVQDCGLGVNETNNLSVTYPELADRLVSAIDGTKIDPAMVAKKSNEKMMWRCDNDPRHPNFPSYVYTMALSHELSTSSKGCPFCRGFQLAPGCSLADDFPDIAAEYTASTLNSIPADQVIPASGDVAYFVCAQCSHEWDTPVSQRTKNGQGCPACYGEAVTESNNFAVHFPDLVKEWHPDNELKATDVRPSSTKKIQWICQKNPKHVWSAKPADRTRAGAPTGCPDCYQGGVSKAQVRFFKALKEYLPALVYETKENTPEECRTGVSQFVFDAVLHEMKIAFEYDGHRWHKEPINYERDLRKNLLAEDLGYCLIRIRCGLDSIGPFDIETTKNPTNPEVVKADVERAFKTVMAITASMS